jgi:hypothetical protein
VAMATAVNQTTAIRQSYQLVTVSSGSNSYRLRLAVPLRRKEPPPELVEIANKSFTSEEAEGATPGFSA